MHMHMRKAVCTLAIHVAKYRFPSWHVRIHVLGRPTKHHKRRGIHHGQTEIVTPGSTPTHHHFDCTHHGGDIWFAKSFVAFPVESCSRIDSQWCSINASCSENPSASSLVPESATQTGRLSSFTAKTHQMTAESGSSSIGMENNFEPASAEQVVRYAHHISLSIWVFGVLLVIYYYSTLGVKE
jgi:hypothetical protein